MITESQALALATLLGHMRTDWNPQGVLALIHKHRDAHDFPALARAAVNAATNPNNRTPAVIFMQGSHWADPNTMTSSEIRMQRGFEMMQRAAAREPQHNPFDPWQSDRDADRMMNELQAGNPEYIPRRISPPARQLEVSRPRAIEGIAQ